MHRYRYIAIALAGVLFCTGISPASLVLTKSWPDAFGSLITYNYNASTEKFTLTLATFSQYTPVQSGTVFSATGTKVYSLTAYIDNTGTPLTPSALTTLGVSDSLKVSGTVNGVASDFFDSNTLLNFALAPGSTQSNAVFEFLYQQDTLGTAVPYTTPIGMILSGPENHTPGFTQTFGSSGSGFNAVADVFPVPEPSSAILMLGGLVAFVRRPGRLKKIQ